MSSYISTNVAYRALHLKIQAFQIVWARLLALSQLGDSCPLVTEVLKQVSCRAPSCLCLMASLACALRIQHRQCMWVRCWAPWVSWAISGSFRQKPRGESAPVNDVHDCQSGKTQPPLHRESARMVSHLCAPW